MKIGFIGTGLMGTPMIKNLLKSKHQISIFNRTISKAKKLKKYGAYLSYKIEELAKDKDLIVKVFNNTSDAKKINNVFWNNLKTIDKLDIPDFLISMADLKSLSAIFLFNN